MANSQHTSDTRLATYGTLAPGQINENQLAGLNGSWRKGTVRGRLLKDGWGVQHGCPGIVLDPAGPAVVVSILESPDLPNHWQRLDSFEGSGYRRLTTQASTDSGELDVSIYVLNV